MQKDPLGTYYKYDRQDVVNGVSAFLNAHPEYAPISALDIGCSSGLFLEVLKGHVNIRTVYGVEPNEQAASEAAHRLDKVWNCYFNQNTLGEIDQKFDLIFFNDSFEHMFDSVAALTLARKLVSPTGLVIFSIPNIRYITNLSHIIFGKDFCYEESGIRDNTHCRFFTRKSFHRLMEQNQFTVLNDNTDLYKHTGILFPQRSIKGKIYSLLRPLLRFCLFTQKDIFEFQLLIITKPSQ